MRRGKLPISSIAILEDMYSGGLVPVQTFLAAVANPSFLCILGSRMFFNLKEAAEHGVNMGTNVSSHEFSAMSFESPPRADDL